MAPYVPPSLRAVASPMAARKVHVPWPAKHAVSPAARAVAVGLSAGELRSRDRPRRGAAAPAFDGGRPSHHQGDGGGADQHKDIPNAVRRWRSCHGVIRPVSALARQRGRPGPAPGRRGRWPGPASPRRDRHWPIRGGEDGGGRHRQGQEQELGQHLPDTAPLSWPTWYPTQVMPVRRSRPATAASSRVAVTSAPAAPGHLGAAPQGGQAGPPLARTRRQGAARACVHRPPGGPQGGRPRGGRR